MIHLWTNREIKDPTYYHHDLLRELARTFRTEACVPSSSRSGIHVCVLFARWLFENKSWFRSLKGPRFIVEHDAYLNFLPESPYYRCWTKLYRECNFDMILSSGKETTDRLREDGLPAMWVPKGCNNDFFQVENEFNGTIGYFGSPIAEQETGSKFHFYDSRHKMSNVVADILPLMASNSTGFPAMVRKFSAAVTDDQTMREPMAKHFECSAMGCAMIRDRQPELVDLGYKHEESMIEFENYADLIDIVHHYLVNPGELREIQRKAIEVTRNHTWGHRSRTIAEIIKPWRQNQMFN